MNENFLEAWVNSNHRVLGKRLKPFCLAHAVALYVIESPYVSVFESSMGERNVSLIDLELAVRVCSSPFDTLLSTLDRGLTSVLWSMNNRLVRDPQQEANKFEIYLKDFIALPETFDKDSNGGEAGAPWPLSVGTLLSSKGGLDFEYAMQMPIGKAMWIAACLGEQMGAIDIMSEMEGSIVEEVLAYRAQKRKENG